MLNQAEKSQDCRFTHESGAIAAPAPIPTSFRVGGEAAVTRAPGPCYSFRLGECDRGDNCRFSHESGVIAAPAARTCCYAFERGECDRGDNYRISHEMPSGFISTYDSEGGEYDTDDGYYEGTAPAPTSFRAGTCYAFQRGECAILVRRI